MKSLSVEWLAHLRLLLGPLLVLTVFIQQDV